MVGLREQSTEEEILKMKERLGITEKKISKNVGSTWDQKWSWQLAVDQEKRMGISSSEVKRRAVKMGGV